jgi:hypothetical protein
VFPTTVARGIDGCKREIRAREPQAANLVAN